MSAALKVLQDQLAGRQRSIAQKTAEIVPMLAAIPEGAVDPEIVSFVMKAHDEAKSDLEKMRKIANGNANGTEKK